MALPLVASAAHSVQESAAAVSAACAAGDLELQPRALWLWQANLLLSDVEAQCVKLVEEGEAAPFLHETWAEESQHINPWRSSHRLSSPLSSRIASHRLSSPLITSHHLSSPLITSHLLADGNARRVAKVINLLSDVAMQEMRYLRQLSHDAPLPQVRPIDVR